jgi:hypothetical protein
VADGVLQDRVPEQGRYRRIERVRRQVPNDLESILEADLLDLDIHPKEVDLLPQGNDLVARMVQREPEESAQPGDHLIGNVGIGVDQLRHGIQGVEEKVRLKLHPEHLEMGLCQPCLELRGMELTGVIQAEVVRRASEGHDG